MRSMIAPKINTVSYCVKRNSCQQYRLKIPIDDDMLYSVILSLLIILNNIKINNYDNFFYKFQQHIYNLNWDRHLDDKPPFVGFTAKYDLQIATLVNRKSFKTKTKILKTLKYGDVKQYFRYFCAKYFWCIDINVLKVKEHNESL